MRLILVPALWFASWRGDWLVWVVVIIAVLWVLGWAASRARQICCRGRSGRG